MGDYYAEIASKMNKDLPIQFGYRFKKEHIGSVLYAGDRTVVMPESTTSCEMFECTGSEIKHVGHYTINEVEEKLLCSGLIVFVPVFNTDYIPSHFFSDEKLFLLNEHLHRFVDNNARLQLRFENCTETSLSFKDIDDNTVIFSIDDIFKWVVTSMVDLTLHCCERIRYNSDTYYTSRASIDRAKQDAMCAVFAQVFVPIKRIAVEEVVETVEKLPDKAATYKQMYLKGNKVYLIDKILPHTVELHNPYAVKTYEYGFKNNTKITLTHKQLLGLKPIPVNSTGKVVTLQTKAKTVYQISNNDYEVEEANEYNTDVIRVMSSDKSKLYTRYKLQPNKVKYAYIMEHCLSEVILGVHYFSKLMILDTDANKGVDGIQDTRQQYTQLNLKLYDLLTTVGSGYVDDPKNLYAATHMQPRYY